VAITSARDAAVRSAYGEDSAAVFVFLPNGRATVIPCVEVGTVKDETADPSDVDGLVEREVFVPARGVEPVQLPRGWAVSGYASLNTIDDPNAQPPNYSGWYDSGNYPPGQGNWVFPESNFFGVDAQGNDVDSQGDMGRNRQTFMIRFEGGTGAVVMSDNQPVLVLLPSPAIDFRKSDPWTDNRLDRVVDLDRAVKRILADEINLSDSDRIKLLGDVSSDTVLARPVPEVALYNLNKLAGAAGASGLSRATDSLYTTDSNGKPVFDPQIFAGAPNVATIALRVNSWIQGELKINNVPIESDAMVYSFQRYLGEAQEIIRPETVP
jgi:hypothetical protein